MGWQLGVGNFIPTYEIGTRSAGDGDDVDGLVGSLDKDGRTK